MADLPQIGHNHPPAAKREADCYCVTCAKGFHHLGIMSHRARHRRANETCVIVYSDGRTITHYFGRRFAGIPDPSYGDPT